MTIRRLLILVVLVAATAAVAIGPEQASAAPKPCWKRLINDWYDGRIDNVYPVKCYREAIKHLPEDVESYSDAREDIQRALLSAIRASGGDLGPEDPVPAQTQPSSQGGGDPTQTTTDSGGAAGGGGGDGGSGEAAQPPSGSGGGGGGDGVLGVVKPANADSVPIPLLVLAGLALVLLAAAAAGFAARRIQARRVRVSPAPQDSNPQ